MPRSAKRGTPEWRRNVARKRRERAERDRPDAHVRSVDLARWEREGVVAESLLPIVRVAQHEQAELLLALGSGQGGDGADPVTPQRRALVEDFTACGIALRGVLQLFLQTHDAELGSRIATLASARRQLISLLGLERYARELDLTRGVEVEFSSDKPDSPVRPGGGAPGGVAPSPQGPASHQPGDDS